MMLLSRRAFIVLCTLTLGATAFLLLALAGQHGRGPLARFARARHMAAATAAASARCPFAGGMAGDGVMGDESLRAYAAIEQALAANSLRGVSENAACIARFFGQLNPDIAASARRLGRLHDVAAARREFRRLTDLFSRRPGDGGEDDDGDPLVSAPRTLEI